MIELIPKYVVLNGRKIPVEKNEDNEYAVEITTLLKKTIPGERYWAVHSSNDEFEEFKYYWSWYVSDADGKVVYEDRMTSAGQTIEDVLSLLNS